MWRSSHRDKGKEHEHAAKDELVGALAVGLVNVVHVTGARNDLRPNTAHYQENEQE